MFSTWIGVVLLFAWFGLLVLVVIGASPRGNNYEENRARVRIEKLLAANEGEMKALTTYAWVDKNKGVVRIPISEAMQLPYRAPRKRPRPQSIALAGSGHRRHDRPTTAYPLHTVQPERNTKTTPSAPQSENRNHRRPITTTAPRCNQPGPSTTPATSPPWRSQAPATLHFAFPNAPGTPLAVRGKTHERSQPISRMNTDIPCRAHDRPAGGRRSRT